MALLATKKLTINWKVVVVAADGIAIKKSTNNQRWRWRQRMALLATTKINN